MKRIEVEDCKEGERKKRRKEFLFLGDKELLPLEREDTDMAHRKITVYKGKKRNSMLK